MKGIASRLLIKMLMLTVLGSLFSTASSISAAESELIVGIQSQPQTLDPRFATDSSGMKISQHLLFSTLVQFGDDLQLIPDLAERWETPNDKTYIFHLRKNVTFHDGQPLTAEDVKFTFEHLIDPATKSPFATTYAVIEKITATDPLTIKFTLKETTASFLTSVVMPILPKHVISKGTDFPSLLIGSGPFKYVSQSPNEIILAKNPTYFMGSPKMDKVVFKIIKDDNTRFLKMKKGELDLVINAIALNDIVNFTRPPLKDDYSLIEDPGLEYSYLCFNMKADPVKDIRIRQAIAYGIDSKEIIQYRFKSHAVPAKGLLSPVNWFAEPAVKTFSYDPKKAKELIQAAGFSVPGGDTSKPKLALELKISNNAEVVGIARVIQAQLARIGIELSIKSLEWGTFYGDIKVGNFQVTSMRWVGVTEPDFYYSIFHSSQFPPEGRNRGFYSNPEIDKLTEQGRSVIDATKRKAIYSKVQKILAEDLPYVSLWYSNNISLVHKGIKGYKQHPMGAYSSFWKVEKEGN